MSNQNFVGRGWSFPIRLNKGSIELADGDAKIRQSIWLILSTAPGERQMLPSFGCGIHELVFEANTASLRGMIRDRVEEALLSFEPRIDVLEVKVESPDVGHHLEIRIDYRVRTNNAVFNMVYPFFLNEGAAGVG